jgi:hypothetical protein
MKGFLLVLTSGHSTVSAFIFITNNQLANASLNVSSDTLSARSPSTFVRSASASSASSARAGSRNPRPCGASECAPERESAKREPCETRRRGVRCGVGPGMVVVEYECVAITGRNDADVIDALNRCPAFVDALTRSRAKLARIAIPRPQARGKCAFCRNLQIRFKCLEI